MKKALSLLLSGLPLMFAVVACSSSDTASATPPAQEKPAESTDGTEPTDDTGEEAPAEEQVDPCACPNTCASESEPSKMVCHPAPPPETLPASQKIGKFMITGYEYWQWKKKDPYDGGNEVAWGYNGDGEPKTGVLPTDQARACMAEARKVLEDILKNDVPPELEAFRAKHGISQFWQWNNDMTDAAASVKVPKNYESLWLYDNRLIKWMSHTERDGSCRLPTRDDLVKWAVGCMETYEKDPACYNSNF